MRGDSEAVCRTGLGHVALGHGAQHVCVRGAARWYGSPDVGRILEKIDPAEEFNFPRELQARLHVLKPQILVNSKLYHRRELAIPFKLKRVPYTSERAGRDLPRGRIGGG